MSIQVTGDYAEITARFSRKSGDISLYFRGGDYGKDPLPGFKIEVCGDRFKNREFTSLEAALKYIEKLHAFHLRSK